MPDLTSSADRGDSEPKAPTPTPAPDAVPTPSPDATATPLIAPAQPPLRLWSPRFVGWSAFLIGFPGGLALAALDWSRMGRRRKAWAHAAAAVFGAGLVFVSASWAPSIGKALRTRVTTPVGLADLDADDRPRAGFERPRRHGPALQAWLELLDRPEAQPADRLAGARRQECPRGQAPGVTAAISIGCGTWAGTGRMMRPGSSIRDG